jgi:hypothetical protein
MSKHTPEPWKISHDDSDEEWSVITNNSGSIVANVNGRTGPELVGDMPVDRVMPAEDNARRIVACVNACTGIRTEALEHRAHMLKAHDDTIAELKRQRDELLAVLGVAIPLIKQARLDWRDQNTESYDEDVVTPYDAILYLPILSLLENKGSAS